MEEYIVNGKFIYNDEIREFKLDIMTYNIQIKTNKNEYIQLEKYLEYIDLSKVDSLIYELYISDNITYVLDEYINFNSNTTYIKSYGLLTILIEPNIQDIHKLVNLFYEVNDGIVKIKALFISKLYNTMNENYDYSKYLIHNYLVMKADIHQVISTYHLNNTILDISSYQYELVGSTTVEEFRANLYHRENIANNLKMLNIANIDKDKIEIFGKTKNYETFINTLPYNDNILNMLVEQNRYSNIDDYKSYF